MSVVVYDRATFDNGGPAPGTLRLWAAIQDVFPSARSLGIYNNRKVRGSSDTLSLHAEGRAVDVTDVDGDKLAGWAVQWHRDYNIQEVIHYKKKRIWTSERANEGWRPYRGPSNYGHIHIGQNRKGAWISPDGKQRDPFLTIASYWEFFEQYGLRPWQVLALLLAGGTVVALELGLDKDLRRAIGTG